MMFIGINGPAGCGKDTLGVMIVEQLRQRGTRAKEVKLAAPLREIAETLTQRELPYDVFKSVTHQPFNVTGRQLMIDVSEKFLKRLYGPNIMTHLLISRLMAQHDSRGLADIVFVVTDMGFQSEANELVNLGHELIVARIIRPGYTFEGDSRGTVVSPVPNRESFIVDNDTTLHGLKMQARNLVDYAVHELGL